VGVETQHELREELTRLERAVVDADTPPSRVIFGVGGVEFISGAYAARLAGWQEARSLLA